MANLPETPQWEDGIYQIEVSDPVLGGPDGISNRQAKQLAKRTSYLKQQVEKGDKGLADHIAAPDPHPQYAPKESPALTGTPTAPTAVKTDNSTKLATTGHVKTVVADYAPLASPGLTGKPTAPTAAQTANDTQLANTAFVKAAIAALVASSPEALDTLNELAAALGNDPNFATTMTNALAGKQPLDNTLTELSGKSVAALLNYLGLSDLVLAGVGNGSLGTTGYAEIPLVISGAKKMLLLCWGAGSTGSDGSFTQSFAKAFPTAVLCKLVTNGASNSPSGFAGASTTLSTISIYSASAAGTPSSSGVAYNYLAIGY